MGQVSHEASSGMLKLSAGDVEEPRWLKGGRAEPCVSGSLAARTVCSSCWQLGRARVTVPAGRGCAGPAANTAAGSAQRGSGRLLRSLPARASL